MKLTWFGGTTIRIHIGGSIFVCDPRPIDGTDEAELVSGADHVFGLEDDVAPIDLAAWLPARGASLLDGPRAPELHVQASRRLAVIAADGEAPLVLAASAPERAGHWARDAVVLAFTTAVAVAALAIFAPRLLLLAMPPEELDRAFETLPSQLRGTSLLALEHGLALEI